MTFTSKKFLALAAVAGIAIAGLGLNAPAEAQNRSVEKRAVHSPTHTGPGMQGAGKLSAGAGNSVLKKDIWGDPDAFLAECNDRGGGASTDQDGFPHCEDSNGGNIPVPME